MYLFRIMKIIAVLVLAWVFINPSLVIAASPTARPDSTNNRLEASTPAFEPKPASILLTMRVDSSDMDSGNHDGSKTQSFGPGKVCGSMTYPTLYAAYYDSTVYSGSENGKGPQFRISNFQRVGDEYTVYINRLQNVYASVRNKSASAAFIIFCMPCTSATDHRCTDTNPYYVESI